MNRQTSLAIHATALSGGALLWLATAYLTANQEAWDAPAYWAVTYPLALLLAVGLGYLAPVRVWRWGIEIMLAQFAVMMLASPTGPLWPIGLVIMAVLAVPAVLAAWAGSKLRLHGTRTA